MMKCAADEDLNRHCLVTISIYIFSMTVFGKSHNYYTAISYEITI